MAKMTIFTGPGLKRPKVPQNLPFFAKMQKNEQKRPKKGTYKGPFYQKKALKIAHEMAIDFQAHQK